MTHDPTRTRRGPFTADSLREDGYYELSKGHPVALSPASHRHGSSNITGALPLATDPAVVDLGADIGHVLSEDTVRSPDLSVEVATAQGRGFAKGAPPLAVEYADEGTNERDLSEKISELFAAGTRFVWVVRLTGLRRVEVHEPTAPVRTVTGSDVLRAPGVLENELPAAALYDRSVALDASLLNLLRRVGYRDLEAVREQGREEGREEGREQGRRAALDELFALRIGRPLTASETLALHASEPTPAKTALFAMEGEALAAWLLRGSP